MQMKNEINTQENESIASPKRLLQLFIRPKRFFTDFQSLNRDQYYFFAYLAAVYVVMDRLDSRLFKEQTLENGDVEKYSILIHSWINYWGFGAIIAIFAAFIVWFVYGWWYEQRLKWCGVKDQPSELIRQVNVVQWSIVAIPVILMTAVQTVLYKDYLEAYDAPDLWGGIIVLFFSVYSCWVSYTAVKTVFNANKYAILWFFFLPLMLYIMAIIIALMAVIGA